MKNYIAVLVCSMALAVPSFAAEHVVTRSASVVAKDTYKVTKTSIKKTGKATESVVKFIF